MDIEESSSSTALTLYEYGSSLFDDPEEKDMDDVDFDSNLKERETSGNKWKEKQRYVGLSNQGATCYMNSLLQTLYMTPEFRRGLYNWKYKGPRSLEEKTGEDMKNEEEEEEEEEESIPLQLQQLFCRLQLNAHKSVSTTALTKSFGWTSAEAFQQHDVQELCRVLFDALEHSFQKSSNKNLVNDLYQGILKDYVKCYRCGHESSRRDHFLDLSLVIRPFGSTQCMKSIEEALAYFLKPEILKDENQWFCAKCQEKQNAIKGLKIVQLPYLLSFQLKRFDFDYTTMNRIKLNNQVKFPKILNMNEYISENNSKYGKGQIARKMSIERRALENSLNDFTKVEKEAPDETKIDETEEEKEIDTWDPLFNPLEIQKQEGPYVYELFSVLIHSGSALGGHYYAYIRSFETNQWYNFNDSNVSEISEEEVQKAWGMTSSNTSYGRPYTYSSNNANAYMLMYRLIDRTRNQTFPSFPDLPRHVQEWMEQEKEKMQEAIRLQKQRANQIQLNITFKQEEKQLIVQREDTLEKVTEKAWRLFNVHQSSKSSKTLSIPLENVRLRAYSTYNKLLMDDYFGKEKETAANLRFYNQKTLYLETRESIDTPWNPYDSSALQLQWNFYRSETEEFDQERYLQLNQSSTLYDLKQAIGAIVFPSIPMPFLYEQLRILKMTSRSHWSCQMKDLEDDQALLKDNLRLVNGSVLYVEISRDFSQPSKAHEKYEEQINLITIKYKYKYRDPKQSNSESEWIEILIDRRHTIRTLKQIISKAIQWEMNEFALIRGGETGNEIKSEKSTIKELSLVSNSCLYLRYGRPLQDGEYRFRFHRFQRPQCMSLRLTSTEIEEILEIHEMKWMQVEKDKKNKQEELENQEVDGSYNISSNLISNDVNRHPSSSSNDSTQSTITDGSFTLFNSSTQSTSSSSTYTTEDEEIELLKLQPNQLEQKPDNKPNTNEFTDLSVSSQTKDFDHFFEHIVSGNQRVENLRREIFLKWNEIATEEKKSDQILPDPSYLRLREKLNFRVGRILRDGMTLGNFFSQAMYEGRTISYEPLNHSELLDMENDVMVILTWWNSSKGTFDQRKEFRVNRLWKMSTLGHLMAKEFQVCRRNLLYAKVPRYQTVFPFEMMTKMSFFPFIEEEETKETEDMSMNRLIQEALSLEDGDVLVFMDKYQPIKQFTSEEEHQIRSQHSQTNSNSSKWKSNSSYGTKETSLRIRKTKEDKQQSKQPISSPSAAETRPSQVYRYNRVAQDDDEGTTDTDDVMALFDDL